MPDPNQELIKSMSMTHDQWVAKYKPRKNPRNNGYGYDGEMWEISGEDLEEVIQEADKNKGTVWTITDLESDWETGDPDSEEYEPQPMVISSGYHYVNRFGYLITEIGHENDNHIEVLDR